VIDTRRVVDVAAAAAILAAAGVGAQENGSPSWWQLLTVAAVAVPVAVRGRWPLPAAVVVVAASTAVLALGVIPAYAAPGPYAAVVLTQYSAAARLPLSRSAAALVAGLCALGGLMLLRPVAPPVAAPAVVIPWFIGWTVRRRRRLARESADESTARAVTEERLRIARDMHDTVAHSLSLIAMKASVARHVAAVRPEESLTAMEVIETVSREALVEMRRAVGLLRADEDHRTPSGSAHDLRALAEQAEQAGVQVQLTLIGEMTAPVQVRLVVYRVVQEALTNVIRHAKATRCTVDVEAAPDSVTVRIADDGIDAAAARGAPPTVAAWRPARRRPAGSWSPPACRPARPPRMHGLDRLDPRTHRRRPDAASRHLPRSARVHPRLHRGGGGRHRPGSCPACPGTPA
jgi:signal transduction histidine kinase